MDVKKFLAAMNEIDDSYISRADLFAPVPAVKRSPMIQALHWAGAAAACLLAVAGIWFLWNGSPMTEPETAPESSEQYAAQEAGPVPLSELPVLDFPTREEAGDTMSTSIGCGSADIPKELDDGQIASIWGQEKILWENFDVKGQYNVTGHAKYVEGNFQGVEIHVYPGASWSEDTPGMKLEIGVGIIPSLGEHISGEVSNSCDVWGTQVTTTAVYANDNHPKNTHYIISFLTGPLSREGTLGLTADCVIDPKTFPEEEATELLTRLASQSLRPENTFQLSQLDENASPAAAKRLTLEDVLRLSEKGENLIWEDFSGYEYRDVGSGLYIAEYPIDDTWYLVIGGGSTSAQPMYIRLGLRDGSDYIDIRTGDVAAFLETHEENLSSQIPKSSGEEIQAFDEAEASRRETEGQSGDAAQQALEAELTEAAKKVAQDCVDDWLAEKEHPLSECFYQNLGITEVAPDGESFVLGLRMVFRLKDPENDADLNYWMAGNTKEGTGENEGYLTAGRQITARKIDGVWTLGEIGTGGAYVGGERVDWPID